MRNHGDDLICAGGNQISTTNHLQALREERDDTKKPGWRQHQKFGKINENLNTTDYSFILCSKHTGSWLIVRDNMVTGTVLAVMEFCDLLCAHYDINPPMYKKCDGCYQYFSGRQGLSCSYVGLIIAHNNRVRAEILNPNIRDFSYRFVSSKPLIHQGRRS